ncbi:MAG: ABC-F family ATP-binding cassette domain-containing protein [Firmicutes bacterium]|nr:ABC-F family ATP-binding cassette domain-containing protein [Bacillota bacterium]
MTILTADSLTFTSGIKVIIENISFSINEGDRLGIVGVNGSGKTTLLNLITGKLPRDGGSVFIARGKSVGMLSQNDAFEARDDCEDTVIGQMYGAFPELIAAEKRLAVLESELAVVSPDFVGYDKIVREHDELNKFYTENGGLYYKSRAASVTAKFGFDEEDQKLPIRALSGGQRTRLSLIRLILSDYDILILDEPTNHLDIDSITWLEGYLSTFKKTLIVVSHDRYFLDRVTTKTLEIENHHAKLYSAPYSGYEAQKRRDREAQEKHYLAQQREIKHQLDIIEQQRRWGQERNFVTIKSRERYLEHMTLIDRPDKLPKSIKFRLEAAGRSGNDVLDVYRLKMRFGGNTLFENLSFSVKRLDRLFIIGANGCGKSTLVKLLTGKLMPVSGSIEYGYNVSVGYYDQENQNLDEGNTVIEELWGEYPSLTQTEVRNTLARFLFVGDDIEKPVSVLSGGERARLTFCKLILSKVNLLILDELTNHLDIKSREALEDALSEFEGTIIAVSHDRYFINKLATRILPLSNENSAIFEGGYDEYTAKISGASARTSNDEGVPPSSNKERYLTAKRDAAEERKHRHESEKLDAEIEATERSIEEKKAELFGEAASDYVRAAELDTEISALEDKLLLLYEKKEASISSDADR